MKEHRKIRLIPFFILLILGFGLIFTKQTKSNQKGLSPSIETTVGTKISENNSFTMHFIDVGQGDATLIGCDGEWMLIDAGDNTKGTTVQLYLKKQNVSKLKYVIGTHPDADHIGGLDVIITKFDCENIFMPDKASDSKEYKELLDAIKYRNYNITVPQVGNTFSLGSASCIVLGPIALSESNNNNSIVLKVKYKDTSFLLSGDAEIEEEQDIVDSGVDLKADVYHAGHHGSKTSSGHDWLNKISPKSVVISCGSENVYGHPHRESLDAFKEIGADVYRTDEQGSIVVTSDGENLMWNIDSSNTWRAGQEGNDIILDSTVVRGVIEETGESEVLINNDSNLTKYILNNNSLKFHYPDCDSVPKIKDKNKEEILTTRDELIKRGYEPCKICNP